MGRKALYGTATEKKTAANVRRRQARQAQADIRIAQPVVPDLAPSQPEIGDNIVVTYPSQRIVDIVQPSPVDSNERPPVAAPTRHTAWVVVERSVSLPLPSSLFLRFNT